MSERKGTKALEIWCRRMTSDYPTVNVDNMTTSWRNGLAFCALIHHFRPDLIDFQSLKHDDVYYNNELAFRTAEKYLGIPALLDPEDMVDNAVPDRLSILTYLSQFYQTFSSSSGTPIKKSHSGEEQAVVSGSVKSSLSSSHLINKMEKLNLSHRPTHEPCSACGLPVYLAQRLLVARQLYHRSCFCCVHCGTQLNPSSCYENYSATEFSCGTCLNDISTSSQSSEKTDDRVGMLNFSIENDPMNVSSSQDAENSEPAIKPVPMERKKLTSRNLQNLLQTKIKTPPKIDGPFEIKNNNSDLSLSIDKLPLKTKDINSITSKIRAFERHTENSAFQNHKSILNINKVNFLVTQLATDEVDGPKLEKLETSTLIVDPRVKTTLVHINTIDESNYDSLKDSLPSKSKDIKTVEIDNIDKPSELGQIQYSSVTFTSSGAGTNFNKENAKSDITISKHSEKNIDLDKRIKPVSKADEIISIRTHDKVEEVIPHTNSMQVSFDAIKPVVIPVAPESPDSYPDNLNPFSDDENDKKIIEPIGELKLKRESMNPFGSSDEEDDDCILATNESSHKSFEINIPKSLGSRRLVPVITSSYNPFWSDGEEPISDDEPASRENILESSFKNNSVSLSKNVTPKKSPRKKLAPKPPTLSPSNHGLKESKSYDDTLSISSTTSSQYSNANSEKHATNETSPRLQRKKPAPPLPLDLKLLSFNSSLNVSNISMDTIHDSKSILNDSYDYQDISLESSSNKSHDSKVKDNNEFTIESDKAISGGWRRHKGPAPGLPLPNRKRLVAPPPATLQLQLQLLEQQQRGLERQGVHLEHLIRQRCEGSEADSVPQDEVEDLVLQLCEIVNEKNELFRKQAELMHIRRQQRLEQEQADVEHEIRLLQSRPHANRTDADKAREEILVSRLVTLVSLRDELVQRLEQDRRREKAEDEAIAASIAEHRAKRAEHRRRTNKSPENLKKGTVKDAVKKHLLKKVSKKSSSKQISDTAEKKHHNQPTDTGEKKKWF